jgi:hypothetical protein
LLLSLSILLLLMFLMLLCCFPAGLASYAVAVYPFALLQIFFLLITINNPALASVPFFCCVPSVVYGLLLQSYCCCFQPYTISTALLPIAFLLSMYFVESLLLLMSLLLQASPASAFVPAVACSLYIVFFPAVTGITCFCLRPCC